jgi:hypothetical protein
MPITVRAIPQPQVKLAKRLDLGKAATAWQNRLPGLILANWPEGTI